MLLLLIDLAAALACPEVQLPAGERADIWAGPLAMAGLCWTDGEPDVVLRDAGAEAWLLTTDGGSVEVRRPASEAAREDLAFLAASMLRAAPSTRITTTPPPAPSRPFARPAPPAEPPAAQPSAAPPVLPLEAAHAPGRAPEPLPEPAPSSDPAPAVTAVAPAHAEPVVTSEPSARAPSPREPAEVARPIVATASQPAEIAAIPIESGPEAATVAVPAAVTVPGAAAVTTTAVATSSKEPAVAAPERPVTAGWIRTGTAITTRPGATAAGALEIGAGLTRGAIAANASIVATLGQHRLLDFGEEPRGWSGTDLLIVGAWAPGGAMLGLGTGISRRRWAQQGISVAAVVIPTATVDLGVARPLGETMRAELGLRGTADLRRTELLVNDELAGVSSPWALGLRLTLAMRTP